jgi:hypothetical protein
MEDLRRAIKDLISSLGYDPDDVPSSLYPGMIRVGETGVSVQLLSSGTIRVGSNLFNVHRWTAVDMAHPAGVERLITEIVKLIQPGLT